MLPRETAILFVRESVDFICKTLSKRPDLDADSGAGRSKVHKGSERKAAEEYLAFCTQAYEKVTTQSILYRLEVLTIKCAALDKLVACRPCPNIRLADCHLPMGQDDGDVRPKDGVDRLNNSMYLSCWWPQGVRLMDRRDARTASVKVAKALLELPEAKKLTTAESKTVQAMQKEIDDKNTLLSRIFFILELLSVKFDHQHREKKEKVAKIPLSDCHKPRGSTASSGAAFEGLDLRLFEGISSCSPLLYTKCWIVARLLERTEAKQAAEEAAIAIRASRAANEPPLSDDDKKELQRIQEENEDGETTTQRIYYNLEVLSVKLARLDRYQPGSALYNIPLRSCSTDIDPNIHIFYTKCWGKYSGAHKKTRPGSRTFQSSNANAVEIVGKTHHEMRIASREQWERPAPQANKTTRYLARIARLGPPAEVTSETVQQQVNEFKTMEDIYNGLKGPERNKMKTALNNTDEYPRYVLPIQSFIPEFRINIDNLVESLHMFSNNIKKGFLDSVGACDASTDKSCAAERKLGRSEIADLPQQLPPALRDELGAALRKSRGPADLPRFRNLVQSFHFLKCYDWVMMASEFGRYVVRKAVGEPGVNGSPAAKYTNWLCDLLYVFEVAKRMDWPKRDVPDFDALCAEVCFRREYELRLTSGACSVEHAPAHLPMSIREHGHVANWSSWFFERLNGYLKRMVHSQQNPALSLMRAWRVAELAELHSIDIDPEARNKALGSSRCAKMMESRGIADDASKGTLFSDEGALEVNFARSVSKLDGTIDRRKSPMLKQHEGRVSFFSPMIRPASQARRNPKWMVRATTLPFEGMLLEYMKNKPPASLDRTALDARYASYVAECKTNGTEPALFDSEPAPPVTDNDKVYQRPRWGRRSEWVPDSDGGAAPTVAEEIVLSGFNPVMTFYERMILNGIYRRVESLEHKSKSQSCGVRCIWMTDGNKERHAFAIVDKFVSLRPYLDERCPTINLAAVRWVHMKGAVYSEEKSCFFGVIDPLDDNNLSDRLVDMASIETINVQFVEVEQKDVPGVKLPRPHPGELKLPTFYHITRIPRGDHTPVHQADEDD